jgi:hypothetical protein
MKAVKERGSSGNPLSLVRALIMTFLSFECLVFICSRRPLFHAAFCALENPGKELHQPGKGERRDFCSFR